MHAFLKDEDRPLHFPVPTEPLVCDIRNGCVAVYMGEWRNGLAGIEDEPDLLYFAGGYQVRDAQGFSNWAVAPEKIERAALLAGSVDLFKACRFTNYYGLSGPDLLDEVVEILEVGEPIRVALMAKAKAERDALLKAGDDEWAHRDDLVAAARRLPAAEYEMARRKAYVRLLGAADDLLAACKLGDGELLDGPGLLETVVTKLKSDDLDYVVPLREKAEAERAALAGSVFSST